MRIVLVHGYLANAAVLWPLARRLKRLEHDTEVFRYPSHKGTLDEHARRLAQLLRADPGAVVAHSLGGLLVHRAMTLAPDVPVSHRVFVATPHRGCRAAQRSRRSPFARLLSPAVRMATHGHPMPAHPARTGVVMGRRDRVVQAAEADLPGADDRITLPFGHNELLMRPNLAHAIDRFVRHGQFEAAMGGWLD